MIVHPALDFYKSTTTGSGAESVAVAVVSEKRKQMLLVDNLDSVIQSAMPPSIQMWLF